MAEQLNMGGLNLGAEQGPGARSYIPPHMRGKMGAAPPNGNPNVPMNGPPGPGGPPPAVNGLNNSAWAG